jgi:hypothetical protein
MSTQGSVTHWLGRLRAGEQAAAQVAEERRRLALLDQTCDPDLRQ